LATSGITSSLLSQIASSPSTANQFLTDLNQLAKDMQSGDLSGAQDDFVTLSQDALNGASASSATTSASGITGSLLSDITSSAGSSSSFAGELNQLGSDLQNGDLSSAQQDLLSLDSTALNAASSAGTGGTPAASSTSPNHGDSKELINAIVQAMSEGDSGVASSALTELASISSSSPGASELLQLSQSLGSGSSSSSQASSISELLQSANVNANNSDSSSSILSLLA
jgi:hypothetical protein